MDKSFYLPALILICGLFTSCGEDGINKSVSFEDCSATLTCINPDQYCNSERKCVDKKANDEICAVNIECLSGNCSNFKCSTAQSSEPGPECSEENPCANPGETCSSEGTCESSSGEEPECSANKPCTDTGKICSSEGTCVDIQTEPDDTVGNECWFYKVCEPDKPDYDSCVQKNNLCEDSEKQCNHLNRCIPRSAADGVGLGESCSDSIHCMTGLTCLSGVCREESFAMDKKDCTPYVFSDRCAGNIIIECDENTGKITVQNCKTNYTNYYIGTTGIFYGADYVCAKRTDRPSYVMCVQSCTVPEEEKYICGWDLDDYDIDYSDKFVCKKNDDDVQAFFPVGSETCKSTCEYETGRCD